ncbi:MAG TPA: rhodanese-like domain-containing protein [Solirubrobacteraceae bacterium]
MTDTELEVTTERTAAALQDGSAQVIDVREDYERAAGRIAGSRHIALGDLAGHAESIDREQPVIFHCHVGSRSLMAAQAFRQAGFDAWSMAGGVTRWDEEGRPLAPEGAYVAEH